MLPNYDSGTTPGKPTVTDDPVNHPAHYTHSGEIECIDAIRAALGDEGFIAFCRGNALKYLWRCEHKGHTEQDLLKAEWYVKQAVATIREVERDLATAEQQKPCADPGFFAEPNWRAEQENQK